MTTKAENVESCVITMPADVTVPTASVQLGEGTPDAINQTETLLNASNPVPPSAPPSANEVSSPERSSLRSDFQYISAPPSANGVSSPERSSLRSDFQHISVLPFLGRLGSRPQVSYPIGDPPRSDTVVDQRSDQANQNGSSRGIDDIPPPAVDFNAPPPYDAPPKLPTYEEVQREKALHGEIPIAPVGPGVIGNGPAPPTLAFLTIDAGDIGTNNDPDSKLLGTDFMFLLAFIITLFFNWVGFLFLMCFCHTVAARYGALSGFGLSLAKWTVIVKGSTEMPLHNAWLWWLITAFGLLICVRSLFQYVNIKRGWRMMSAATQERLLFFY